MCILLWSSYVDCPGILLKKTLLCNLDCYSYLNQRGLSHLEVDRVFGLWLLGLCALVAFYVLSNSHNTSMLSAQGVGPSYQAQTQKEKQPTALNAPTVKKISSQSRGSCARTTLPAHGILTSNRFDALNQCAVVC